MKYFCSTHACCGDWKETEELAAEEWNRRAKDYTDFLNRLKTPGTPEFLEIQGNIKAHAYCEECEYETDRMTMKDLVFKLSMEGGYIISDKEGGYYSKCPKCGSENLSLGND
jgi:predicted nucleic-acid-binding Zn-ribbon protein